jgi:hypothetical protein
MEQFSNRKYNKKSRGRKENQEQSMDINEAHVQMGQLGETSLSSILDHHGTKATGTFKNCINCMKWRGGNKQVWKIDVNTATIERTITCRC